MHTFKFIYSLTPNTINGDLIYRQSEYSLDFILNPDNTPMYLGNKGFCSISINTLQLEVDIENRKILYPWGYFPTINYISQKINIPQSVCGNIYISNEIDLKAGVSYDISDSKSWKIFKDIDNGWICISGNKNFNEIKNATYIEFVKNSILCIKDNIFISLFIKPLLGE
jgi:hypothetical protein